MTLRYNTVYHHRALAAVTVFLFFPFGWWRCCSVNVGAYGTSPVLLSTVGTTASFDNIIRTRAPVLPPGTVYNWSFLPRVWHAHIITAEYSTVCSDRDGRSQHLYVVTLKFKVLLSSFSSCLYLSFPIGVAVSVLTGQSWRQTPAPACHAEFIPRYGCSAQLSKR